MGGGKMGGGLGDGDCDSGINGVLSETPERQINLGQSGNSEFGNGISNVLNSYRNRNELLRHMPRLTSFTMLAGREDSSVTASSAMGFSSKSSFKSATMTSPIRVENSATVAASRLHRGSSSRSRSPPTSLSRTRLGSSARLDQDRSEDNTASGGNDFRARSKQQRSPRSSCDNSKFFSGDSDGSAENGSSENGSTEDGQHEEITEIDPQTSQKASPSSSAFHIEKRVRERLLSQGLPTEVSRSTVLPCLNSGSNNSSVTGTNCGSGSCAGAGTGSQKSDGVGSELLQRRELSALKTHFNRTIVEHENAIFDVRGRQLEQEEHLVHLYNLNNERQMEINGIIQNQRHLMNQIQRNGVLHGEAGFKCPDCGQLYASRTYMEWTHRGNSACRRARGYGIQRGSRGGGRGSGRGGGGMDGDGNGSDNIGLGLWSLP